MKATIKIAIVIAAFALVAFVAGMLRIARYRPPSLPTTTSSPPAFHDCAMNRYDPIRISDYFTQANVVRSGKPTYPEIARSKGITGDVSVQILINLRTGQVERTCAYSGPPELWLAAEEAAIQWQFRTHPINVQREYAQDFLTFKFVKSK